MNDDFSHYIMKRIITLEKIIERFLPQISVDDWREADKDAEKELQKARLLVETRRVGKND